MATSKQQPKLSGNNLLIVMILVTLLVVGVTALAVKFLWADITLDQKVITAKDATNKTLSADVDNAPKLISDFNNLGPQATILADALPNSSDFPSLIVTLENITNDAGVTLLRSVSAVPGTTDSAAVSGGGATTTPAANSTQVPTPVAYDYIINFNTSYTAFKKMLGDFELSARPMRVTAMQLNGSGTGSNMSGELDVETYYQGKASLPFGTKEVK